MQVVLSVDVAALQAGREENVAHGFMVVAEHEVAPKLRLGEPWLDGGGSAAIVIRPDLDAVDEGRIWLAASLAAAQAVDGKIAWPDTVFDERGAVARVNVTSVLAGPTIRFAVVSVRQADSAEGWSERLADVVNALERTLLQPAIAAEVDVRLMHRGARVQVGLMPRGDVVGTLVGVSTSGAARLEMGSGRVQELPVGQARALAPVSPSAR